MRFIPFLVVFLSLSTDTVGQKTWQPDTQSTTQGVLIQNGFPRGGARYTDSSGKDFIYAIFWTRVVNESNTPLELIINFPADSFAVPSPYNYAKLFVPPDTMTLDKQFIFDYGLALKSFLDKGFHKPTLLQRTLKPKEECAFYIAVLSITGVSGPIRAGLILKEQDLFYRINMLDPALIPCGRIVFKK